MWAWVDALALGSLGLLLRAMGYRCVVGRGERIGRHAERVLATAWGKPLPGHARDHVRYRYRHAPTWIVCYRGSKPVGCMALFDPRHTSYLLDLLHAELPEHLHTDDSRELSRLAVDPAHRGGAQRVMVALLRSMVLWCRAHGVKTLLTGSRPPLFRAFGRFNPTGRLLRLTPGRSQQPAPVQAHHAARRREAPDIVTYTFELSGASPSRVLVRVIRRALRLDVPASRTPSGTRIGPLSQPTAEHSAS